MAKPRPKLAAGGNEMVTAADCTPGRSFDALDSPPRHVGEVGGPVKLRADGTEGIGHGTVQ
jgi:hypothetical protein